MDPTYLRNISLDLAILQDLLRFAPDCEGYEHVRDLIAFEMERRRELLRAVGSFPSLRLVRRDPE